MLTLPRIKTLCLLAALAAPLANTARAQAAPGAADEALRQAGQAIYRDGVLASGAPLIGKAAAGVQRVGQDAACVACHRRSGFGIAEGNLVVRPITAPDLFQNRPAIAASPRIQHQLGTPRRGPYNETTLASAIRTGRDIDGREMDNMMPRYALGERDMAALQAYLKTLFATPDPGVNDQEIRLATVIQPGVKPERRRAMLEVLQAYVRDKNSGTRSERARRTAGTMRMHRAYRTWVLDVWELDGAPGTWHAQLEARYRQQPVFALVSGIGDQSWQPIQEFSERFRVPCVLPLTTLPGSSQSGAFYTVYFSRGIALEAQALANYLGRQSGPRHVVQVWKGGDATAQTAADAFRAALPGHIRLKERVLQAADAGLARALAADHPTDVVLWLRGEDLVAFAAGGGPYALYLSGSMVGDEGPPDGATGMTYPWQLPALRAAQRRGGDWLRARLASGSPTREQIDAYFAIATVGEALAHLMDSFSRDYFIETIEHGISTTLLASSYPALSLGPDQRFASKGVYLVRRATRDGDLAPLSELIVP